MINCEFKKCPACNCTDLVYQGDEVYCKHCGLVLDDQINYEDIEFEKGVQNSREFNRVVIPNRPETKPLMQWERNKVLFNRKEIVIKEKKKK